MPCRDCQKADESLEDVKRHVWKAEATKKRLYVQKATIQDGVGISPGEGVLFFR